MLIDPASKVSVPLTVVIQTWVRVSESDLVPFMISENVVAIDPKVPAAIQVFEDPNNEFFCFSSGSLVGY